MQPAHDSVIVTLHVRRSVIYNAALHNRTLASLLAKKQALAEAFDGKYTQVTGAVF